MEIVIIFALLLFFGIPLVLFLREEFKHDPTGRPSGNVDKSNTYWILAVAFGIIAICLWIGIGSNM